MIGDSEKKVLLFIHPFQMWNESCETWWLESLNFNKKGSCASRKLVGPISAHLFPSSTLQYWGIFFNCSTSSGSAYKIDFLIYFQVFLENIIANWSLFLKILQFVIVSQLKMKNSSARHLQKSTMFFFSLIKKKKEETTKKQGFLDSALSGNETRCPR